MAMLQKSRSIQADQKRQDNYRMSQPRLGIAMIIDKMSTPRSKADVARLKEAYDIVGFDVYTYNDGDAEKYETIKTWMCARETHQFCNAFALVMMCKEGDGGRLFGSSGEELTSIDELVQEVNGIPTLEKKPKLITIQAYPESIQERTKNQLPELPLIDDVLIAYSQITEDSVSKAPESSSNGDRQECGSENLKVFATFLKNEYKDKTVQELFYKADTHIKEMARITERLLMNLAKCVGANRMEKIAISDLHLSSANIENLKAVPSKHGENLNFELLRMWKNSPRETETTKEKLAELMKKSGEVDPHDVDLALELNAARPKPNSDVKDGLIHNLFLSEFHMTGTKKIRELEEKIARMEKEKISYEDKIQKLNDEKTKLEMFNEDKEKRLTKITLEKHENEKKMSEQISGLEDREKEITEKLQKYQEQVQNLNEELDENRDQLERIKAEKEALSEKLKETTDLLEREREMHEREIAKMKEHLEKQSKEMWEAESKTQKNLLEAAELSNQRIKNLGKDQASGESLAIIERFKEMNDETEKIVNKNKVVEYEGEITCLREQLQTAVDNEIAKGKIIEGKEKEIEENQDQLGRIKAEKDEESEKLKEATHQLEENQIIKNRQLDEMKTFYELDIRKLEDEIKKLKEKEAQLQENQNSKSREFDEMKTSYELEVRKLEDKIEKLKEKEDVANVIQTEDKAQKDFKEISLHYETTLETGLGQWNRSTLCMMESNGDVVLFGKEKAEDPAAFHVFSFRNEWQKTATRPGPCSHDNLKCLSVTIGDRECILVSCSPCCIIWFFDIQSGHFIKAFEKSKFYPGLMCKAEGENIFIARSINEDWPIHKAKVCPTEIILDDSKIIETKMMQFNFMHYLPDVKRVVVSKWSENVVKAVSCDPSVRDLVIRGKWEPQGLFYYPEQQLLFVCDEGRIVVVDPTDGSNLQSISLLDPSMGLPMSVHMHSGNIIVHNRTASGEKVNIYAIEQRKDEN